MLSDRILRFYHRLPDTLPVPRGVEILSVYKDPKVRALLRSFYARFYHDDRPRTLVLGINPGRFGGGLTGIPFTDPVRLATDCGIPNSLPQRRELSSEFIYRMIGYLGGVETFFSKNLLSAVCPLGFVRDGKNLNYYDEPALLRSLTPFIVDTLQGQFRLGVNSEKVVLLGEGLNVRHFESWNREFGFSQKVISLPHPRFIMQYRRKSLPEYLDRYAEVLS
jgi:hypothetical protein